jgi:hypothetical protein
MFTKMLTNVTTSTGRTSLSGAQRTLLKTESKPEKIAKPKKAESLFSTNKPVWNADFNSKQPQSDSHLRRHSALKKKIERLAGQLVEARHELKSLEEEFRI